MIDCNRCTPGQFYGKVKSQWAGGEKWEIPHIAILYLITPPLLPSHIVHTMQRMSWWLLQLQPHRHQLRQVPGRSVGWLWSASRMRAQQYSPPPPYPDMMACVA